MQIIKYLYVIQAFSDDFPNQLFKSHATFNLLIISYSIINNLKLLFFLNLHTKNWLISRYVVHECVSALM